jgi:hypothetical protein
MFPRLGAAGSAHSLPLAVLVAPTELGAGPERAANWLLGADRKLAVVRKPARARRQGAVPVQVQEDAALASEPLARIR